MGSCCEGPKAISRPTTFRFYDGSESQDIDPLIGSIEGIASTPAYRGLALAVFENLELADFGNRIPFMTFEIIADVAPLPIASILTDASAGKITCDGSETISGYAAYGASIGAALQPLVDWFDLALFDDGSTVRSPTDPSPLALAADELGNSVDGQRAPVVQRERLPVRTVPSTLRVTYYDPDRDYQPGEARAIAGEQGTNEVQQELPAVLTAADAKTLAQRMVARQWSARDKLTLRLPPARLGLEPGSIMEPEVAAGSWIVETSIIDGLVTIAELRPAGQPASTLVGDAGRIVANDDVVQAPTTLALIDVPTLSEPQASTPTTLIAASSPVAGWSSRQVTITSSGQSFTSQAPSAKSILGSALSMLAPAEPYLIDEIGSVDVQLIDPQQWMTSCDDVGLADGLNLAVLGSELLQFGSVMPLGEGRFRLSRLLRGRGATEWASSGHAVGEMFCVLIGNSVRPLSLPMWTRGSVVTAGDRSGGSTSITFGAESIRPLAPVDLSATLDASGNLVLEWTRRSRAGLVWLDEVDVPIGEAEEQYRVNINGPSAELELPADAPSVIVAASDVLVLGSGPVDLEVRQLGDWAASRPAQLTIELP